ncbi:MAG: chlorite dismutase family protein [Pyrinomonadaceae bacterium]
MNLYSMTVSSFQKEQGDGGLRLVSEPHETVTRPEVEKQFVNFMFLRVHPDWRKLDGGTKRAYKQEFERVFDSFRGDFLLFSYSLVGFDSKADLMFWRIGKSLDLIQEMTSKLYRTEFGSYLEAVDNYLSTTKTMMFVEGTGDGKYHVEAGSAKYHFVNPCAMRNDWFEIPADERDALMKENFMVGKRFPNIRIHMTHAFGFNDNEYLMSFETDEPGDFLALAEELRETPAGKLNVRGMPVYTCRQRPLMECLDALG